MSRLAPSPPPLLVRHDPRQFAAAYSTTMTCTHTDGYVLDNAGFWPTWNARTLPAEYVEMSVSFFEPGALDHEQVIAAVASLCEWVCQGVDLSGLAWRPPSGVITSARGLARLGAALGLGTWHEPDNVDVSGAWADVEGASGIAIVHGDDRWTLTLDNLGRWAAAPYQTTAVTRPSVETRSFSTVVRSGR